MTRSSIVISFSILWDRFWFCLHLLLLTMLFFICTIIPNVWWLSLGVKWHQLFYNFQQLPRYTCHSQHWFSLNNINPRTFTLSNLTSCETWVCSKCANYYRYDCNLYISQLSFSTSFLVLWKGLDSWQKVHFFQLDCGSCWNSSIDEMNIWMFILVSSADCLLELSDSISPQHSSYLALLLTLAFFIWKFEPFLKAHIVSISLWNPIYVIQLHRFFGKVLACSILFIFLRFHPVLL